MLIFHMFFYCIYVKNYQIIFDRVEQQILIRKKISYHLNYRGFMSFEIISRKIVEI